MNMSITISTVEITGAHMDGSPLELFEPTRETAISKAPRQVRQ
jgi:hypothetical protein